MAVHNEKSFAYEFTNENFDQMSDVVAHKSGWLIGLGILMVLVGMYAVIQFLSATVVSTYLLGVLMIIAGVVFGANAFIARRWNIALLDVVAAALYIFVGLFALRHPIAAAEGIALLLGALFCLQGVMRVIGALAMMPAHWGWLLFSGIMSLILGGIVIMQWPMSALWLLGTLVGIELLFCGFSMLGLGISAYRFTHHHGRATTV